GEADRETVPVAAQCVDGLRLRRDRDGVPRPGGDNRDAGDETLGLGGGGERDRRRVVAEELAVPDAVETCLLTRDRDVEQSIDRLALSADQDRDTHSGSLDCESAVNAEQRSDAVRGLIRREEEHG